ncbi:RNA pseudouridine synthase 7 [Cynara cardunculus var. scolymus]|uniref:RNA pseudouridine synthase 7 n=1 Tax=Cynara cardunculus var. scolymus TaxID=59895 RepID=UPI000D62EEB8|nr:RNA pseudouridine synthase 7 [Cynara cardunculus var. scolymus]
MKRNREDMEIVWQTPANPPERRDYIFRNGIRYVKPYYFEFISHAKNRWAGKTIVDLFAEEFKGRNRDYYDSAVKSGRIQVDGKTVPVSYRVQSSQKISHFVHRHEPPVMALDVKILHEGEDVLTVYKPASVPVHPCGQYRKNTVVGILQAEHDLAPVFPVHRLDRLVSGLLILARSASQADLFRQQIESGMVQKQYIAKVVGEFPEEQVVNLRVNFNAREGRSTTEPEDMDEKGNATSNGKAACTKFTRISTNGKYSIVSCHPITGRTHQIRVHLQSTGHPIANDTLYLTEFVDGGSRRTFIAHKGTVKSSHSLDSKSNDDCISESQELIEDFGIDPMCTNCPNLAPIGYDGSEEGLWLHCVRYSGPGWVYECPYPHWASL